MSEWRDVETAPKDGSRIWLYQADGYPDQYEGWCYYDSFYDLWFWQNDADSEPEPTHWMPLPSPPEENK